MSAQFKFEAIGTKWIVDIFDVLSPLAKAALLKQIRERIDIFDKNYSRFRADSLVTEMSQKAGEYVLPDDAEPMMNLYWELFGATGGLLTPLIGQVMVDAGYDPQYSLRQKKQLEKPLSWDEALEYEHPKLTIKKPVLLDFGAAGKGYLIDLVGEVLEKNDVRNFTVDAGGDILHRRQDGAPLQIGLENPQNFAQVIGTCELSNVGLAASAGSRRKWQNFHHIINPETLESPREIIGTWVVADTTLLADALATALFFVPPEKLSQYRFEYVILYSDFSIRKSGENFRLFFK